MMKTSRLFVLGSTGSIGRSTIDVVSHFRDIGWGDVQIIGLAANRDVKQLAAQAHAVGAKAVAIADSSQAKDYEGPGEVLAGPEASAELVRRYARPGDTVLAAVVGAAGIHGVLAGIEKECRIALANKEALVAAGAIVMPAASQAGVDVLPVDSEHSAIFQCLASGHEQEVARIVLTASGGPFRGRSRAEIANATVEEALAHPTWQMGRKITIDSATLANKALEVIEAHWLFGLPSDRIDAIVHPQSIIHGFVEFSDGSVIAQAGPPDMRTPIQYALTWPHRTEGAGQQLDWAALSALQFEQIDHDTFPMIHFARNVIDQGGTSGAIFNAANEAAVEFFLEGKIHFGDIFELVASACETCQSHAEVSLDAILADDQAARKHVEERVMHVSTS